jgi:hypothetical protein
MPVARTRLVRSLTAVLDWSRPDAWQDWLAAQPDDVAPAVTARRLRANYAVLRSFHAARPSDAASYYRSGIVPLTRERWHALVAECFLDRADDPILSAAIRQARDVQFELIRDGRVHFCCDRRLLEERDGYHLLYGSLSLLAVAIRIDKAFGTDFKTSLRSRGAPTVFVCDVPTGLVEDETLASLVGYLRRAETARRACGARSAPLGFHYSIPHSLPAVAVVGDFRPTRVIDAVYGHHIGM